eukprot:CAMPEP_0182611976 /NCGR_PEP_ID=MMETSP1330-20130603/16230_1 /TAXON_ID=464278 /ORGANISM="Picochlorum sp., Strain RCC944" /LENGTH=386 /DNA_ID=CAMNT_0024831449 /DNA_START=190 /DNA_END=1346 /DNA_ORIENTATION=+
MASSSVWRRVPAFLPNLILKLVPLSEAQQAVYAKTGFVKELVFKTVPQATKGEIKNILEGVYGLEVEKVKTVNYLGKKKRGRDGFYRRADFKKAYVSLKGPEEGLAKGGVNFIMGTNEVRAQETASGQPLVHALGVVPTELPAGMIPNLDQKPIFVSLQEKREIVHGSKVRNSRAGTSHTYAIKFFLVDSVGNSHFAAVGYDGGDSHYQYSNRPEFPPLSCHNKTEVKAWAERIINASQQSSGYRVDVVKDEVPSKGGSEAINLPQFVSYTEAKKETPDGRRQICWYLLDSLGHNHLAVVGEEKDTRDGHYLYKTESVFDKVVPLEAHNQEEVKKWLNWMIGPRIGPMPAASASIAKGRLAGLSGMSERPMREAKRGRGRGRGRGG